LWCWLVVVACAFAHGCVAVNRCTHNALLMIILYCTGCYSRYSRLEGMFVRGFSTCFGLSGAGGCKRWRSDCGSTQGREPDHERPQHAGTIFCVIGLLIHNYSLVRTIFGYWCWCSQLDRDNQALRLRNTQVCRMAVVFILCLKPDFL
jgi:hypothetical protein